MRRLLYLFALSLFCFPAISISQAETDWTVMVYMAADNDLEPFVMRNLKQMMRVGSNKHVSIVAQVNSSDQAYFKKTSQTYYVEKNNLKLLPQKTSSLLIDSGDPETLIDFCLSTMKAFPAKKYALVLWDHGTGPLDPFTHHKVRTVDLFSFFDSSEPSLDSFCEKLPFATKKNSTKGVCFDDTTGNYLTEQKLLKALQCICKEGLQGGKFGFIGFDACLMAMVEVASCLKNYTQVMVASQEVELGTGWDYAKALLPLAQKNLSPQEWGAHVVKSYAKTYSFSDDYTLSCLDLESFILLEDNITDLARYLHHIIKEPEGKEVKNIVKLSRYRNFCTYFDEPDFIDFDHFYKNLRENLQSIREQKTSFDSYLEKIDNTLKTGQLLLKKIVVANQSGNYFTNAQGLSIYFPEHFIHQSYRNNLFATSTNWLSFLRSYLS